jgi:hypothetical protein
MVAGTPAGAGEPAPTGTITIEPASGPPGRPFTFSGGGCVSEAGPGVVEVVVSFGGELILAVDPGMVTFDDHGTWGVGMVPNGFMSNRDAVGTWDVTATCFDAETEEVLVDYAAATFEVIEPPAPPTTPPTTSPTPTVTLAEPQPAQPASPVAAKPAFTG